MGPKRIIAARVSINIPRIIKNTRIKLRITYLLGEMLRIRFATVVWKCSRVMIFPKRSAVPIRIRTMPEIKLPAAVYQ